MLNSIITLASNLGTFAFCLSGIQFANTHKPRISWFLPLAAFLCSHGGGLTRDIFFLHCQPAFLSSYDSLCILLLTLMFNYILFPLLSSFNAKTHPLVQNSVVSFDAAGTAVFISVGIDAAAGRHTSLLLQFMCGIITACGGSILTALFAGHSPKTVFQSAISYRLIVVFHSLFYTYSKTPKNREALITLMIFTCLVSVWGSNALQMHQIRYRYIYRKQSQPEKLGLSISRATMFWMLVNPKKGIISSLHTLLIFCGSRIVYILVNV